MRKGIFDEVVDCRSVHEHDDDDLLLSVDGMSLHGPGVCKIEDIPDATAPLAAVFLVDNK